MGIRDDLVGLAAYVSNPMLGVVVNGAGRVGSMSSGVSGC
jgi:hypothetical protein